MQHGALGLAAVRIRSLNPLAAGLVVAALEGQDQGMSSENDIMGQISRLVDEEHELREKMQRDRDVTAEETDRLKQLSSQLDEAWNVLRRRRATDEFGVAQPAASAGEMRPDAGAGAGGASATGV